MQPISAANVPAPTMLGIEYSENPKDLPKIHAHDEIVPNNLINRSKMFTNRYINAWTTYPIKGLTGNKNANFYEFLTMGMVPYTIGSAMLIALFNAATPFFHPTAAKNASRLGIKMGLGVLFYGLAKHFSKKLVDYPVKWGTGVDINLPYIKAVHELPEPGNNDPVRLEWHHSQESIEFPRSSDLFPNYKSGPEHVNARYDKINRNLGYEGKLPDSDQLVKPGIRDIVTKTKTVTYLTQYLWAALGVMLAAQEPWEKLVNTHTTTPWIGGSFRGTCSNIGKKIKGIFPEGISLFVKTLGESAKSLYNGGPSQALFGKVSGPLGKAMIFGTVAATALGAAHVIMSARKKDVPASTKSKIDKNQEYMVN